MAPLMRPLARPRTLVIASALTLVGAAGAVLGAAGLSSAGPDDRRDERDERPAGIEVLEGEIDAMVDAGLPEGDPKLEMLQDELAELRQGLRVNPPREPGVDLSDVATSGARRAEEREQASQDEALWDDGTVVCEPIPPDLLTAEEVAGATCRSELQPDGSNLYVATRPDGTEHAVRFAPDGSVTRLR
jgi:hypothetical protein